MNNHSDSRVSRRIRDGLCWFSASWRADRAKILARLGRRCDARFGDDEWTEVAIKFHHFTAAGTLAEQLQSSPLLAAVAGAMELAEGAEIDRLAVETRLIALDDLESIATKTGRSVAVIQAYEKLFLDFRERYDGTSWMHDRVFGSHSNRHQPQTLRSAVLTLAYRGKAVVADAVLDAIPLLRKPCTWDRVFHAGRIGTSEQRITLMAVASVMAPRSKEAGAKLGRQYRKLMRETGLIFAGQKVEPSLHDTESPALPLWERYREQIDLALVNPARRDSNIGVA